MRKEEENQETIRNISSLINPILNMVSNVCQFYQLVNAKVLTVPSIDFITQLRLQEIQKNNKKGTVGIVRMLVKVNICIFLGHISSKNIGDQIEQNP